MIFCLVFLAQVASGFYTGHRLSFVTLFKETSRPVFGTVCPHEPTLHILLENSSHIKWENTKRELVKDTRASSYAIVCNDTGGIIMFETAMNGNSKVNGVAMNGTLYWHSWGHNRKFYLGKREQFSLIDGVLSKNERENVVRTFTESIYGCSVSFRTGKIECNKDPHAAMLHVSGLHRFGSHALKIASSFEGVPSSVFYDVHEEYSDEDRTFISSDLPEKADEVRIYKNIIGPIYCSYHIVEEGKDVYVFSKLALDESGK
jgi:hypothetical protein